MNLVVGVAFVMLFALAMPASAPEASEAAVPPHASKEKAMSGLMTSRPRAPRVEPVMLGGVRFEPTYQTSLPGPEHVPGVLGAYDAATGTQIWTLRVTEAGRDSRLESDVREDHIKGLALTPDGKLQVLTETGRRFEVDPAVRSVRPLP